MAVFIDAIPDSLKHLKKNWVFIPLIALLDLLFLIFFGVGGSVFRNLSAKPIKSIVEGATQLGPQITQAIAEGQSAFKTLLADPSIALSMRSLVNAFLLFVALVYIFWILFNGASWFLSYRMISEKQKFKFIKYFTKFSIVSVIWVAVLSIVLALITRFIFFALLRPDQILSSGMIQLGSQILQYVLFYFIIISLALVPFTNIKENFKKTFLYGIKQFPNFILALAIITLVLYLNFKITYLIFLPFLKGITTLTAGYIVISLVRFIIAAPFLTWARMYLMIIAKKVI